MIFKRFVQTIIVMAIYKGQISDDFIKAEISFEVSLPKFCEDQEFTGMISTYC
jgi:hypothetical protein